MTQLPTIESLDEAAKAAGFRDWDDTNHPVVPASTTTCRSIIAHAHTLDKLHNRTQVDPDVEAVKAILKAWNVLTLSDAYFKHNGSYFNAAVAEYKKRKVQS